MYHARTQLVKVVGEEYSLQSPQKQDQDGHNNLNHLNHRSRRVA